VWADKGTSRACDACDQTITDRQIEYEPELPGDRVFRLHAHCLELWHRLRIETISPETP
jgi:hypothetical protein